MLNKVGILKAEHKISGRDKTSRDWSLVKEKVEKGNQ
jgi:hypothetical protein